MPLLFETSEQAQYLIPAAISLAWGELFATPITLLIVPVLMNIAGDKQWFLGRSKSNSFTNAGILLPSNQESKT
jgi:hypothetical protein